MNEFLTRLRLWWETVKEKWDSLTLNQKVMIAGAVLLLGVSAGMLVSNQVKVEYEPLYTQLAVEDAAAITEKLDAAKISYRLADEGSTIMVPTAQKYRTRLMLAGEGLPRGIAGLETFQKPQFGETETDKRIKYLAAMQGELTRTIQSLDKIQTARVHLVMPEPSLYSEQEETPTASVMVKLKPGQQLTAKEIQGIVNLVANSVERLQPENVAIVDKYSNLLSFDLPNPGSLSTAELSSQQMAMKRQLEREKQHSIQSMLDATLGSGKSVVRVSAELNFDEVEKYVQNFDPSQRVVISKHTLEESSTSTEAQASPPGVDTNVPIYVGEEGERGTSSSEKSEKTVNYEGDKEETKTRVAPGAVKRLTVAVLVDEGLAGKQEDIREAVANAGGVDEDRGDRVSVNLITFQPRAETVAVPQPAGLARFALPLGIAVLILLAVVIWLLARRRQQAEEDGEEAGFEALLDEEIPLESLVERELSPEEMEKQRIRDEVNKMIDENPEGVAHVIRSWILDEKR